MNFINEFLFQIIIIFTNIIQIAAGFGGSIIAIPFSVKIIDFESVKMVLNTYSEVGCIILMLQTFKEINWKEFIKMTIGMTFGILVGWKIVSIVNLEFLMPVYALFVIAIGIYKLAFKHEIKYDSKWLFIIVLFAGIIHGIFLSGGCMLVVYAVMAVKDKTEFRATLNAVWVVIGFFWILYDYFIGNFTTINIIRSLIGIATLAISIPAGNFLFKKLDQRRFLNVIYILVIIAGINLLL